MDDTKPTQVRQAGCAQCPRVPIPTDLHAGRRPPYCHGCRRPFRPALGDRRRSGLRRPPASQLYPRWLSGILRACHRIRDPTRAGPMRPSVDNRSHLGDGAQQPDGKPRPPASPPKAPVGQERATRRTAARYVARDRSSAILTAQTAPPRRGSNTTSASRGSPSPTAQDAARASNRTTRTELAPS